MLMFLTVVYQFYKIQIIDHDEYAEEMRATVQKEVDIPAIRGIIYDRYGKPLAINKAVYMLKVDPQVSLKLKSGVLDQTLLNTANLLIANGDTYIDNVPISATAPFVFTEDKDSVKRFITNYVPYDNNEQKETVLYNYSAAQLIQYLRGENVFNIDEHFSDEDARKIIAMRLQMRQTTYQKYKQVTLAQDISMETLVAIEENKTGYPSIFTEVEAQRYYPYKEAFGNILGYTRTITESQYASLKDQGYEQDDIVGQVGIESTQESELRGEKGSKLIEVDNVGATVDTLETKEATAGNDIYLSIDAELQVSVYQALEKRLTDALIQRLRGGSKTMPLTGHDVLVSMAKNNQLDIRKMSGASENTTQRKLYDKVLASYQTEEARLKEEEKDKPEDEKTNLTLKQHFANMLEDEAKPITDQELLLAMGEQQTLQFTEDQMASIKAGNYNVSGLLITLFEKGLLKPDQMDITPSSGSAVVVDPHSGQTLALVSYPSYDNNDFIQDFNGIYRQLHDGVDARNIEINRALKTAKAPGSTFKMITAIAGLEEGVITPDTVINDTGIYTYAGIAGPHCWVYDNSGHGHGPIRVEQALEVSCNYFFNDVAYRLGLKYGNPYGGIDKLTDYVKEFGLGDKTGIELEEVSPNLSTPVSLVSNQSAKALNRLRNLKDQSKEDLYEKVASYYDSGFYSLGDSNAVSVEGQIDYLSRPYIKDTVDKELGIVLSEGGKSIFDKMLGDFNEEMTDGVSSYAAQIASEVMAGDSSLSLKNRTKTALAKLLTNMVQPGTRKTILKVVNKIPDGVLQNAYLEGYKQTLADYQNDPSKAAVCTELRARIAALQAGTYDYQSVMADKIMDRIISTYLDDYFSNVELSWNTGINIRTGMGQGDNAFTPVQMARYVAGLVNGKTVYNLSVISGIKDHKGTGAYHSNEPKVYNTLNIDPNYLKIVYTGMHDVVSGSTGTARSYFADLKVDVAGKTGTAQANEGESSCFVGFAPYDNPQISIVTSMYGTDGLGSNNSLLARDVFEIYFRLNKETEKVSIDNQFMP